MGPEDENRDVEQPVEEEPSESWPVSDGEGEEVAREAPPPEPNRDPRDLE